MMALPPVMTKAGPLLSAQALHASVPRDPPFLTRFRLRRLLTYLWIQGCSMSFFALLRRAKDVYFCVHYLALLVRAGRWTDALSYIVPRLPRRDPLSLEARLLCRFLSEHRLFQLEVTRKQLRMDMAPAWAKAAEIVTDLANRTPEFRNRLLLPAVPMGQQNVLPIGFGFAPFRRRGHAKKHRQPSAAIAKLYLHKRRTNMQLSSTRSNHDLSHHEFAAKELQSILREGLREALRHPPHLNQGSVLQSSVWEGTLVTGNVINPERSSVPLTNDEGAPVTTVCRAMFGDGISSAENSAMSSMAKTGDVAVSQTMLGTMACPAKTSEVISAASDGTGQEVCYTESARQGSYPRKRPMTEQQEDYMDVKKQRTTGANGEASTCT